MDAVGDPSNGGILDKRDTPLEYVKPEVHDHGDLKDLTASATTSGLTDVPKGNPQPAFS
jgi:hypothetical protein